MKPIFLLLVFLALTCGQEINQEQQHTNSSTKRPAKRHYVCPPHFIRLSHRCYYFSTDIATWQDAYFQCRDLHSNLATIKNANQDKLIRRTLSRKTSEPFERWLGGRYDWEQMRWKWAASGKSLTFQGFSRMDQSDKERLQWHCIVVDPYLQYKWNSRSCVEEKRYICQTKIKVVGNKGKKKLLRQYNVDKYNKLNEIPVPDIDGFNNNNNTITDLKANPLNSVDLNGEFALKMRPRRKKNRKNKKKKRIENNEVDVNNITTYDYEREQADEVERRLKKRRDKMQWRTYLTENKNPLAPRAIIEEFELVKES